MREISNTVRLCPPPPTLSGEEGANFSFCYNLSDCLSESDKGRKKAYFKF